jgi:hypothetical protein
MTQSAELSQTTFSSSLPGGGSMRDPPGLSILPHTRRLQNILHCLRIQSHTIAADRDSSNAAGTKFIICHSRTILFDCFTRTLRGFFVAPAASHTSREFFFLELTGRFLIALDHNYSF